MNIKLLRERINYLYDTLAEDIENKSHIFKPSEDFYHSTIDKRIAIQNMARQLIVKLDLCKEIGVVLVSFENELKVPGQVELSNDRDFFISLNKNLMNSSREVGAVLAHEIMHIYLNKKRLYFKNEVENEKIVDMCTILYGFGIVVMNGMSETIKDESRERRYYGYLEPSEFGYLFARYIKQNNIKFEDIENEISGIGKDVLLEGFGEYKIDNNRNNRVHTRYLKIRSKINKILKKYSVAVNNNDSDMKFKLEMKADVIMNCNKCFKIFKVPFNAGNIKIKCPRCRMEILYEI